MSGKGSDVGERLSTLATSFLHLEHRTTPMHVGRLAVLTPPDGGFRYEQLVDLIEQRIAALPRYRQRVRTVPGQLANPVWVDDPQFDISFHVRRSALPKPGRERQLLEICSRILSRPLDRSRPLWELYLIEGLPEGRVAVLSKTHQAMIDGSPAADIAQLMLDRSPTPRPSPVPLWMPAAAPTDTDLILAALGEAVRTAGALMDPRRLSKHNLPGAARRVTSVARTTGSLTMAAVRQAPASPLNVPIGEQRRLAVIRTELSDYHSVRREHGGTVDDIILATVAGAVRGWLLFRRASVPPTGTARVMVVRDAGRTGDEQPRSDRSSIDLVDLPVGEPNPVLRLTQVGYLMHERARLRPSVDADTLVAVTGTAPPTLQALSCRVAARVGRRLANLVITEVPGPQVPLYAAGARMVEMFPFRPLTSGHALSVGLTRYDGWLCFGLTGDRDAMPDLDILADLIGESLAELVGYARGARRTGRATLAALPGTGPGSRHSGPAAASRTPAHRRRNSDDRIP